MRRPLPFYIYLSLYLCIWDVVDRAGLRTVSLNQLSRWERYVPRTATMPRLLRFSR